MEVLQNLGLGGAIASHCKILIAKKEYLTDEELKTLRDVHFDWCLANYSEPKGQHSPENLEKLKKMKLLINYDDFLANVIQDSEYLKQNEIKLVLEHIKKFNTTDLETKKKIAKGSAKTLRLIRKVKNLRKMIDQTLEMAEELENENNYHWQIKKAKKWLNNSVIDF